MRKSGPKGFYHKEEEEMPLIPPREPEEKETQLARWEYQRIENELSDVYYRMVDVLKNLKKSNPSEYSRLADIIKNSIEELRIRIHQKAVLDFPELTRREKRETSRPNSKEIEISITQVDNSTIPNEDEITWADLCRFEPELLDLWSEAKEVKDTGRRKSFCAYDYFSENIADRLTELLGPWNEREIQVLNTIKSIDLAKDIIFDALPPCRHCKQHQPKPKTMPDSQ